MPCMQAVAGRKKVYTELEPRLADARKRAKQRLAVAEADNSDNPSTQIHLLLDAMAKLKQMRPVKP